MWLDVADALSDQDDADGSNPALDELESVRLQLREMISDRDAALDHIAQLRDINRSLRSQLAEELESLKSRSEENHQLSATNIQLAAQVMDLKAKLEVAEDVKNLIEDSAE
jgi:cell division protein FtsB